MILSFVMLLEKHIVTNELIANLFVSQIYEDINVIKKNPQGGKQFDQKLNRQYADLDSIGQAYLRSNPDATESDVQKYKETFMLYDLDASGDINLEELKLMMEKLGQAKTHMELKKMISQVDTTGRGVIVFNDFLTMMLGKGQNSILKMILMFEEKGKEKETPKGLPPKKSITDLP
eukprot:Phypoly_transcript_21077.p1 GENE.Phypoly_transcript_21077~~Phypoly_transcript_21077.p1  ORF type:complete len:176 (+),score=43.75 Phypoly_transcript_21077:79-606(+)